MSVIRKSRLSRRARRRVVGATAASVFLVRAVGAAPGSAATSPISGSAYGGAGVWATGATVFVRTTQFFQPGASFTSLPVNPGSSVGLKMVLVDTTGSYDLTPQRTFTSTGTGQSFGTLAAGTSF